MVAAADGNVWFTDLGTNPLRRITPSGKVTAPWARATDSWKASPPVPTATCGSPRLDRDNRAMVLTGTGEHWEKIRVEGLKILQRLVQLPLPVVGVANGPATVHSEYLLLCDVHIASDRAVYGDIAHPAFGVTAGDGLQVVWEELAGTARAKWLLWTGETIDAATAQEWGVVNEVLPHSQALARGLELATKLAAKPDLYRALQKQTLNQHLRRRIAEGVPYGMALEGLTASDLAYQPQAG